MKKPLLLLSFLVIILSIVISFAGMVYKDTRTYQNLAEKDLENVLSLSDIDISNHIENAMTKPVMVSKTMANDEFLKQWLINEPENAADEAYMKKLYDFLKAYQVEYGYTTVFCISAQTGNYYYQDGLNKTISKSDEHDVWYYNFTESGHEYDLEVDTNEANENSLTVFVNFRMESDGGRLLGVIGVGLQINLIEDTIRAYEQDYDLSVHIINVGGAENSFTGNTDIFISEEELAERTGIRETIRLSQSAEPEMQWFSSGGKRKCLITKYNEAFGWHLVLEKDTTSMSSAFQERVLSNVSFMIITLATCILVVTAVFINYNRRILKIENTDELTGLPNRKLFFKQYPTFIRRHSQREKTMFMFDIDHFKDINDTYGHMFGNTILQTVGEDLLKTINGDGIAARWGGDEFLGMLAVGPERAREILGQFMDLLRNRENADNCRITVSVGIAGLDETLSMEEMIKCVDAALYRSKESGRDRITTGGKETGA